MLNTKGGAIAIGLLETHRYRKRIEKLDIFTYEQINDFLAIGIDFEADKFNRIAI